MRYFLLFLSHTAVALAAIFLLLPEASVKDTATPATQTSPATRASVSESRSANPDRVSRSPGAIEDQPTVFRAQLAAHQLAAASDIDGVRGYLDQYVDHRDVFYRTVIAFIFLERLIELDPMTAVGYVETAGVDYQTRQNLLASIVTTWVRHDDQAAINYYLSIQNAETRNMIGARLLMDPVFAGSALASSVQESLGQYGRSISAAARRNQLSPDAAFDEALRLTGVQRRSSLMTAVSRWSQVDPEAAIARITALTNPSERQMALQMLISQVSRHDAFTAYDLLQTHLPGDQSMMSNVIPMMMSQDPGRGLPYLRSFSSNNGNLHVVTNAITQWATRDMAAAITFAESLDGPMRTQAINSLTMTYLQTDAAAAMRWVNTIDNPQARARALTMLPQFDLALAETWLDRVEKTDPAASSLLANIARQRAGTGLDSTMAWLSDYQSYPGYPAAVSNVLAQHARLDPRGAARFLEGMGSDSNFTGAFQQLASGWSASDPDAATAWARALPRGANRQEALSAVIMNLAHRDRTRAVALLSDITGERRNQMKFQLAHILTSQNPTDAAAIAAEIGLTEEQAAALRQNFNGVNSASQQLMMVNELQVFKE